MPVSMTDISPMSEISHSSISPGQGRTRIQFDVPTSIANEAAMSYYRTAKEITTLPGINQDNHYAQRIKRWGSGCITLAPIQQKLNFSYENPPDSFPPDKFTMETGERTGVVDRVVLYAYNVLKLYQWKFPHGVGVTKPASTTETGDPFQARAIPADGSYADESAMPIPAPQVSGEPGIVPGSLMFPPPSVGINTVYYTKVDQIGDQGFCLRWIAPGTPSSTPDFILNFMFGQYCLIFDGSGSATLAEYCEPPGGGAKRWRHRTSFQYCAQGNAIGTAHRMMIFPHRGAQNEKIIAFDCSESDGENSSTFPAKPSKTSALGTVYYPTLVNRGGDIDPAPKWVTMPAPIRIDERRTIRPHINIGHLVFWNRGIVRDGGFGVPDFYTLFEGTMKPRPFQVRVTANFPPDADGKRGAILATVKDIDTGDESYIAHPAAEIQLTGNSDNPVNGGSFSTPLFWGYLLSREANIINEIPGKFEMPVSNLRLSGISGGDPVAEAGSFEVKDLSAAHYDRLSNRGEFEVRAIMDYQETPPDDYKAGGFGGPSGSLDGGSPIQKVVLARGYAVRPDGLKRGSVKYGNGGFSPYDPVTGDLIPQENQYPSKDWHDWTFLYGGMARRTQDTPARAFSGAHFGSDPTAPIDPRTGINPPWKVTDVIRLYLQSRGFTDAMIQIPNIDIRLSYGAVNFKEQAVYQVNTDPIQECKALCRNYLGGFLIFDHNAGDMESTISGDPDDADIPTGAWRIVFPPPLDMEPVYHFFGKQELDNVAGLINPFGSAGFNQPNSTCVMAPFRVRSVAPYLNHLWISTMPFAPGTDKLRIDAHIYNFKSYRVPGSTNILDPTSPHYIGRERMYPLIDATLIVQDDVDATRAALRFVGRRIMRYAGCGRKTVSFVAPLVLITDADTGRKRPLRYYDPVSLNTEPGWYIRTCDPVIKTLNHLANYELEKLEPF